MKFIQNEPLDAEARFWNMNHFKHSPFDPRNNSEWGLKIWAAKHDSHTRETTAQEKEREATTHPAK